MTTLAFVPPPHDEPSSTDASMISAFDAPGLTLLLARTSEAKARILSSLQQGPLGPARPTSWKGPLAAGPEALVIRAQDLHRATGLTDADPAVRPAVRGSAEHAARRAIASLRGTALALLADDARGGRIGRLAARLRELDEQLAAALAAEQAERARIEPLLAAAAAIIDLERQRERVGAEQQRWRVLIDLWPDRQQLQVAHGDVERWSRFARVASDTEQRHVAVKARCDRAERALRGARRDLGELVSQRDELRDTEPMLPAAAEAVATLCTELPLYRSRLLELAATRARLDDLERTLAHGVERLGRDWDLVLLSEIDASATRTADLQGWQERSRHAQSAYAAAERTLAAARARERDLGSQASEHLARLPADSENQVDLRWQSLWELRAQLEEIWDVQSRAEADARTLADREDALRRLDARTYRTPPRWLLGGLTVLTVSAAVLGGSAFWLGHMSALAAIGLVAGLALLRLALHGRARWVRVAKERRSTERDRLWVETERVRRRRDVARSRAAELTDTIRAAAVRLALPDPVTPEAVEACEQDLAARLRSGGAHTPLTALLLELLKAQEDEQHGAAQVAECDAARRVMQRQWEVWRDEAGFPHNIQIERIGPWLEELRGLAATRTACEAAREQLRAIEPITAAWETVARQVLRQAGGDVRPELCGSALASELTTLAARLRRQTERRAHRARIKSELRKAEQQVAEAEAELAAARAAAQELLSAAGVNDEPALRSQLEGWHQWRTAQERVRSLQTLIDDGLARLESPTSALAELASGAIVQWQAELRRSEARLSKIGEWLNEAARRRRAAEGCVEAAREAVQVGDLRLEREAVLAELGDLAREWKLRTLAAALLETSLQELSKATRRDLLHAASQTLAALTRGRYTRIARSEQPPELTLVDREGRRVPVGAGLGDPLLGHVNLSLLLAHAAQVTSGGNALRFVLDDVLGSLSLDDAQLVAQEIATLARAHPVLYLATAARRNELLAALPGAVTVVDVE